MTRHCVLDVYWLVRVKVSRLVVLQYLLGILVLVLYHTKVLTIDCRIKRLAMDGNTIDTRVLWCLYLWRPTSPSWPIYTILCRYICTAVVFDESLLVVQYQVDSTCNESCELPFQLHDNLSWGPGRTIIILFGNGACMAGDICSNSSSPFWPSQPRPPFRTGGDIEYAAKQCRSSAVCSFSLIFLVLFISSFDNVFDFRASPLTHTIALYILKYLVPRWCNVSRLLRLMMSERDQ